jgi:hypothetical protein
MRHLTNFGVQVRSGSRSSSLHDRALFADASQIRNPVSIFADPKVRGHFTTCQALARLGDFHRSSPA